jgi:hypothetical protein
MFTQKNDYIHTIYQSLFNIGKGVIKYLDNILVYETPTKTKDNELLLNDIYINVLLKTLKEETDIITINLK